MSLLGTFFTDPFDYAEPQNLFCVGQVLIAVVCDHYDYSLLRARELFLRSRLNLVGGLELQGFTRARPARYGVAGIFHRSSSEIVPPSPTKASRSPHEKSPRHRPSSTSLQSYDTDEAVTGGAVRTLGDSLSFWLHGGFVHRQMRNLLAIRRPMASDDFGYDAAGSAGDEDGEEWLGRVLHLQKELARIVDHRVAATEERLLQALDQLGEQQAAAALGAALEKNAAEKGT